MKRHHSKCQNYVKDCIRCLKERDAGQFSRSVMRRMSETSRRKKNKVSKKIYSLTHSTHTDPPNSDRQKENAIYV